MKIPLDIVSVHAGLKEGEYSAVELLEAYIARIAAFDSELNSYITLASEQAYKSAKNADRVIKDNPRAFDEFPLLGIPYSLKDLYLTEGIKTSAGAKLLEGYIPPYSSTVFERLEKAGGVLVGKTNLDAWAHGASGENSEFGDTLNPWDKTKVPGGSSSGSAVTVASQFAHFSMGTDTGGSVRLPASFNNLVGLKPTYGVISRYGVIAMASSLDTIGTFTRNVRDSEVIFNVVRGPDGFDSTVASYEQEPARRRKKAIGVPREYFTKGMSAEVGSVVRGAIDFYERLGYEVVEVSLPHTEYAVATYYIIQPAEVSSNLARFDGVRFGRGRETFGDEAQRRIILGTYSLSSGYSDRYYLQAAKVRQKISKDFENVFEKVDVLIAPVSPNLPFGLGEKTEDPLEMYLSDILTSGVNLAGVPSIAVPGGFSKDGLPIGFQIIGPRFSEAELFALAIKYQDATDWHTKTPAL